MSESVSQSVSQSVDTDYTLINCLRKHHTNTGVTVIETKTRGLAACCFNLSATGAPVYIYVCPRALIGVRRCVRDSVSLSVCLSEGAYVGMRKDPS